MRYIAAIVVSLVCAVLAAAEPRPCVARITVECVGSTSYGSGVLVCASGTEAVVLTNWHVIRPPRRSIHVRWPNGKSSHGRVLAADSTWDLAAVGVAIPDATPAVICRVIPKRGERLTIAGYGPGPYLEQSGPVTGFAAPLHHDDWRLVELRATARLGDSGGPIFNERGELAGVLYGVHDGLTVGPCCTRVARFLDEVGLSPEATP